MILHTSFESGLQFRKNQELIQKIIYSFSNSTYLYWDTFSILYTYFAAGNGAGVIYYNSGVLKYQNTKEKFTPNLPTSKIFGQY